MKNYINRFRDAIMQEEIVRFASAFDEICDNLGIDVDERMRILPAKDPSEWQASDYIAGAALVSTYIDRDNKLEKLAKDIIWKTSGRGIFAKYIYSGSILSRAIDCCIVSPRELYSDQIPYYLAEHFVVIPCSDSLLADCAVKALDTLLKAFKERRQILPISKRTIDKVMAEKFVCDPQSYDNVCELCDLLADAQLQGLIDQRGDKYDPQDEGQLLEKVLDEHCSESAMAIITQDTVLAEKIVRLCPEHIIAVGIDKDGEFFIHFDAIPVIDNREESVTVSEPDTTIAGETTWKDLAKHCISGQGFSEVDPDTEETHIVPNQQDAHYLDDDSYGEFIKLINEEDD